MKVKAITDKLFKEAARKSDELHRRIFDQAIQAAWEDGFQEGIKTNGKQHAPARRKEKVDKSSPAMGSSARKDANASGMGE